MAALPTSVKDAAGKKKVVTLFGRVWDLESLPNMCVFDCDYTIWPFWVDTHVQPPFKVSISGAHRTVSDARGKVIRLYPDVFPILRALRKVPGLKIALASRTEEPDWLEQLAKLIHVPPGDDVDADDGKGKNRNGSNGSAVVSLWDFVDYKEIYPRSKLNHFRALNHQSGIACDRMLFFDDEPVSNREVTQLGVTFVDASRGGMTEQLMVEGLLAYISRKKGK